MTNIKRFILSYISGAVAFLALDFIWLSLSGSRLYQPILSAHLAATYDWKAVTLFYPLYFIGIIFFAVRPSQIDKPLCAAMRGVLFGVIAYGTYDLTNQATFSGWPWMLTGIDMVWGGFATGCAAWVARAVLDKMTRV